MFYVFIDVRYDKGPPLGIPLRQYLPEHNK